MARDRGIAVVGVLLRFHGGDEVAISKMSDRSVVARVI